MNNSFVLENILTFAALFLGIWLIKKVFNNKMSSLMHYLLWGVVVLKLVLPFSFDYMGARNSINSPRGFGRAV